MTQDRESITLGDVFYEVQKMGRELSGLSASSNLLHLEVRNLVARQNFTDERLGKIEAVCMNRSQSNDKHRKIDQDKIQRLEDKLSSYKDREVTSRIKLSELEKKQSEKLKILDNKYSTIYKTIAVIAVSIAGLFGVAGAVAAIYRAMKGN